MTLGQFKSEYQAASEALKLGQKDSLHTTDKKELHTQWMSYRRGDKLPNASTVSKVEHNVPGTKLWIDNDFWEVLSYKEPSQKKLLAILSETSPELASEIGRLSDELLPLKEFKPQSIDKLWKGGDTISLTSLICLSILLKNSRFNCSDVQNSLLYATLAICSTQPAFAKVRYELMDYIHTYIAPLKGWDVPGSIAVADVLKKTLCVITEDYKEVFNDVTYWSWRISLTEKGNWAFEWNEILRRLSFLKLILSRLLIFIRKADKRKFIRIHPYLTENEDNRMAIIAGRNQEAYRLDRQLYRGERLNWNLSMATLSLLCDGTLDQEFTRKTW